MLHNLRKLIFWKYFRIRSKLVFSVVLLLLASFCLYRSFLPVFSGQLEFYSVTDYIISPESICGNNIIELGEQCDPTGCAADQICLNCQCQPEQPPVIPPPQPPITPPSQPPQPPTPITIPIISQTIQIFENPQVEQASQNIATPILLAIAVANTLPVVLALSIYLLPYLHLIFLEPFLLLFRKKRKKWGIVYNSLTKIPVDLALVRLYSQKDKKLIQTKVTDRQGRYLLIVPEPGSYYLEVTKPGFISPTKYLKEEKQDAKFIDLYHGEEIKVTEKGAVITANIPLDPAEKKIIPLAEVIRSYLIKNLRHLIAYLGLVLAILIVLIIPTVITIGALILHVLLYLVFRRTLIPPKPKSWGIVYDEKSKEPLKHAIVRIFDLKFNKLLETQVTDSKGRYSFLVGKNEYQLLTEKEGYKKKEIKPVDLVKKEQIVNLDVGLQRT